MKNLNKMKIAPDMQYEIGQDKVGYFPEWSVKDDATLYEKVNKLAHSTFDRSKFTVVGSPNITDDGIASGFRANTNYIKLGSLIPYDALNYKLCFCVITPPSTSSGVYHTVFSEGLTTNNYIASGININYSLEYERFVISIGNGTTSQNIRVNCSPNTKIYLQLEANASSYIVKYSFDGVNYELTSVERTIINRSSSITNTTIGCYYQYTYSQYYDSFLGSIDLKQFSITVDGVEVFSGNKTGIDTIKPDDYTVVGTPTISAEGIASGFSASNYINSGYAFRPNNRPWKCYCRFTVGNNDILTQQGIIAPYGSTDSFSVNLIAGKISVFLSSNGSSWDIATGWKVKDTAVQGGEVYYFSVEWTGTQYILKLFENGVWTTVDTKDSTTPIYDNTQLYYIGTNRGAYNSTAQDQYFRGSIDLNAFKIYVDGDLVYQPCLKIPYTEGQNYVKVVDKLYRNRVKDLFEQKGYNGYYTIGEDDFTLPSNKWSDIVEHKENGLTVAEQRVDQTLTIRGACEQGVDVNLPMEFFSDDSYAVFGVGTTGTNTASKFTPAADGNYIAIGKGKV